MGRLKWAISMVPALMAFTYAAVVGLDAAYIGLVAAGDALSGHGFGPGNEEWRFRSRGHYFWYGAAVSAGFTLVGVVLKRLLAPPSKSS